MLKEEHCGGGRSETVIFLLSVRLGWLLAQLLWNKDQAWQEQFLDWL